MRASNAYKVDDPTHPNTGGKTNCYWLDRLAAEAAGRVCADFIQLRGATQSTDGPCQDHPTVPTRCQAEAWVETAAT